MTMTELARRDHAPGPVDAWRLSGSARIDDRPARPCTLTIGADGSWTATVSQFTLAGTVDLFFESSTGGQFCGPAFVVRSGASTDTGMGTALAGVGPLLVAKPSDAQLELGDAGMVDGEVVGE